MVSVRGGGRLAAALFVLCGALVASTAYLMPASPGASRPGLLAAGVVAAAVGLVAWYLPWERWPLRASLLLVPVALTLEAVHNVYTGLDGFRYPVFFMVTFAWIGLAHRQGTAIKFLPLLVPAYLVPIISSDSRSSFAFASLAFVLPVCGVLGETASWVASRLRMSEEALRVSESSFRTLFASHPQPMWVYDATTLCFLEVNTAAEAAYGYRREEFLAMAITDIRPPEDVAELLSNLNDVQPDPETAAPWRHQLRDGSLIHVEIHSHSIDFAGRQAYLVMAQDMTDRLQAESAVRQSEERFRGAFDHSAIGSCVVGTDGRLIQVNRGLCELLGYSEDELVGTSIAAITHPDDLGPTEDRLRLLDSGELGQVRAEKRYLHRDGHAVWVEVNIAPIREADGKIFSVITQMQDISDRKTYEAQLSHQALHDHLTGLPNRVLLLDRIDHALRRRDAKDTAVGVFFLDVDRFKMINDSYGHAAGDRLLVGVAERLRAAVRPEDTVARLGGDEFVILCEDVGSVDMASRIAVRIGSALSGPFASQAGELYVSASVGIALAHAHCSAEDLLRNADAAMYQAKERGRACHEVFDETLRQRVVGRLETENELRRAIERGELRVHYQPVISLLTGRPVTAEALVRWQHPVRGLLPPGEFIPVAEESGLIIAIGEAVLREACTEAARWVSDGAEVAVSVNLSARQLCRAELPLLIKSILWETQLAAERLCLEVTESMLIEDVEVALQSLTALKHLGVKIAVDDFGTGYSSLAYLRRFPIDMIKVDRAFVAELDESSEDLALVGAIVQMSHALGVQSLAEGVERPSQMEQIIRLGCDLAQGYLFARPQPALELRRLFGRDLRQPEPAAAIVR